MGTFHKNAWQPSQGEYIVQFFRAEALTIRELYSLLQAGHSIEAITSRLTIDNPSMIALQRIADVAVSKVLLLLGVILRRRPAIADRAECLTDIMMMAQYLDAAIRPVERWIPQGKAEASVLQSLRRHLFMKYAVPACLERETADNPFEWFVRWSSGESPRRFVNLPYCRVTPRILHLLQYAPTQLGFKKAFYWATAVSLGISESRATALMPHLDRLQQYFKWADGDKYLDPHPEVFLLTWLQYLANHPEIEIADVSAIADYIFYRKYEYYAENSEGIVLMKDAKFSLKHRMPVSLKSDVDAWHQQLMLEKNSAKYPKSWRKSNIPNFELSVSSDAQQAIYHIVELNTQADLFSESRNLRHCVKTYVCKCASGNSSIWSLRCSTSQKRLVTIELINDCIVQARGKFNRLPTEQEVQIIKAWMAQHDLKW